MPTIPKMMTAIEIAGFGGPEVLKPASRPIPKPGAGEVLIRVAAAGVNRPDVFQRQGGYAPPPGASDIPGLEVAGTVAEIGPGAQRWRIGDPVTALVAGGGYAEFCAAPAEQCLPIPKNLDMVQAAAIPETWFTVWSNVIDRGRLQAGESILIHGGASGIGTSAIQLAKARGARVFATAGSDERCRVCESLGAERAINYRTEDFGTAVKDATHGQGVDVILDMVGGPYIPRNLAALAPDGRLVFIAFLGGPEAKVNFNLVMRNRLTITGSTLRPRPTAFKAAIARALEAEIWPLFASGKVRPIMDMTFPLADAARAHARIEGDHIGKIVLTV